MLVDEIDPPFVTSWSVPNGDKFQEFEFGQP